jgi:hypothetical protein
MKAISKLKSGKAVGLDSLPNEILKSGGSILVPILQKLFNLVFTSKTNYIDELGSLIQPGASKGEFSKILFV